MSHVITCPSGLTGRIRGMKVREERVLADRKLAKSGGQVDALLGACWEETLEPGPYDLGDKDIDWGAVLQGDRFFALLQVRALTYGPTYAFALGCQNEGCRARFEWELQLRRNAGERILSAMLGWRVVEVEGVSPKDKRRFLEDLSMRDADFLVDEFDRVDCGVDTALEVECPECFTLQEVELPFDRGFFLPGKARTARRRDRTSSSLA